MLIRIPVYAIPVRRRTMVVMKIMVVIMVAIFGHHQAPGQGQRAD